MKRIRMIGRAIRLVCLAGLALVLMLVIALSVFNHHPAQSPAPSAAARQKVRPDPVAPAPVGAKYAGWKVCRKMAEEGLTADEVDALFYAMASDLDPVQRGLAKIECAQAFIDGGGS